MKEKIKKSLKSKFLGEYEPPTNKQRSLIILLMGFTVLFGLIILVRINNRYDNNTNTSNNNSNNSKNIEFLSLDKIIANYVDNYEYNITINDNNNLITYEGNISSGVNNGKKKIDDVEINYHIVNNTIIDLDTNKEIPSLYENYIYSFFEPNNIYEFIKDQESIEEIVDNNKVYTYNSVYDDGEIAIKITTSKDRIESININYNNIDYDILLS